MRRASTARSLVLMTLGLLSLPSLARPQTAAELQQQMQEMQASYEARLRALEQRLAALEAAQGAPVETTDEAAADADETATLQAAAAAAAGETVAESSAPFEATSGHERNLNVYNPEISFTGDVLGSAVGEHPDFDAREFELDFQSALDPFSSTKWTIAFTPEEVEVEEGYIKYDGLLPGVSLRAGKMRQTFGAINRWHQHALPTVDYPLVLQRYFGEEGLAQTGLSAEWLLPRPWASANELTVQVTDGSAEPFGGDDFHRLAALVHLKNYWDLSDAAYLEWGLSGIAGSPAPGIDSRVWGTDLTFHWQPPARAKYRELTWRSELLLSQRDDEGGIRRDATGGYSYVEALVHQNWYAGLRYDRLEDPQFPELSTWSIEPFITFWQSEFVRLRAAWQRLHDEGLDTSDRLLLQITWAAGPHKHETY